MTEPTGSATVVIEVQGKWALSLLTSGWSDEEKAALLAGDREAGDALYDEAVCRTLRQPDDIDKVDFRVFMSAHEAAASDETLKSTEEDRT